MIGKQNYERFDEQPLCPQTASVEGHTGYRTQIVFRSATPKSIHV